MNSSHREPRGSLTSCAFGYITEETRTIILCSKFNTTNLLCVLDVGVDVKKRKVILNPKIKVSITDSVVNFSYSV